MIMLPSRLGVFSNNPIIDSAPSDHFTVRTLEAFSQDRIVYVGFPLTKVGDICYNVLDYTFWLYVERERDIGESMDDGVFESPAWMKLAMNEERVDSDLDDEYFTIRLFTLNAQLYQGFGNKGLMNEVYCRSRL